MRFFTFGARATRHAAGAVLEAGLIAALAVTLVFGAAVVTRDDPAGAGDVYAAKGGKPGAATAGAFIRLDQAGQALRLGDKVTFTTSAPGLNGGEYPMVVIRCYQGGELTYAQLDHPGAVFVLGGGSSAWKSAGGEANCAATLYAYGGHTRGGYDTIVELAGPVEFHAGG